MLRNIYTHKHIPTKSLHVSFHHQANEPRTDTVCFVAIVVVGVIVVADRTTVLNAPFGTVLMHFYLPMRYAMLRVCMYTLCLPFCAHAQRIDSNCRSSSCCCCCRSSWWWCVECGCLVHNRPLRKTETEFTHSEMTGQTLPHAQGERSFTATCEQQADVQTSALGNWIGIMGL